MEGILDQIGADGTVAQGFAGAVKTELGPEYADTNYLDDVTSISGMAKRGIDTRRKNTELTEAAKNAIARPAEGATDEQKAEYRKTLRTELGATGNVDDYNVVKPADLPEGLPWNAEANQALAQFCCDQGIPVSVYETMRDTAHQNGVAGFNLATETATKAAQDAHDAGVKVLTDSKTPPELLEMGTLARKAIEGYGLPGKDAEHNKAVSLATATSPSDFEIWRQQGVSPTSFAWLARIGKDMVAGSTKLGDGTTGIETAEAGFVAACSGNSPALQG